MSLILYEFQLSEQYLEYGKAVDAAQRNVLTVASRGQAHGPGRTTRRSRE